MENDYYKISDLIYREFVGELSKEETNELHNWIDSNDRNKQYYQKLFTAYSLDKIKRLSEVNTDLAWKKFNNTYRKKTNLSVVVRYAALIVLIVSIGGLLYLKEKKSIQPKVVSHLIESGTSAAVLKIEGKKEIALGKNKNINLKLIEGVNVAADSSNLSYNIDKNITKKEKAVIHTLEIPRGGEFFIILSDGTRVWVNSETSLKYPSYFEGNKRAVELDGEAYFEVSKNKNKPFIVHTKGVDIEVLGTGFNVNSYKETKEILTTLIEGRVKVSSKAGEKRQSLYLTPGMQSVYNKETRKSELRKNVNTDIYTAWKRGFFMFEDERLDDIIVSLSRWYNMEVFFEDKECRDLKFTGEFRRYDDFSYILKFLKLTKKVDVRVKGTAVYIKSL